MWKVVMLMWLKVSVRSNTSKDWLVDGYGTTAIYYAEACWLNQEFAIDAVRIEWTVRKRSKWGRLGLEHFFFSFWSKRAVWRGIRIVLIIEGAMSVAPDRHNFDDSDEVFVFARNTIF
jgi:hypothetical protein